MKGLAIVMVLAGCDTVIGLSERLPIDAPPDAPDGDTDGIADDVDNCPTTDNPDQLDADLDLRGDACDPCPRIANENGHDEDGDSVGDECDNCPHVDNKDQLNRDNDGIGNACDLAMTFECIRLFDPFTTLPATNPLNVNIGTWIVENDELVQTDPGIVDGYFELTPTFTTPRLEVAARIIETPDTGPNRDYRIGAWVAIQDLFLRAGVPRGVIGTLIYAPVNNGTNLIAAHVNGAGTVDLRTVTLSPTALLDPGETVRLRVHLAIPSEVALRADVGPSVGSFSQPIGSDRPPGRVGLRVVSMTAGFAYVVVIETQPTGPCL